LDRRRAGFLGFAALGTALLTGAAIAANKPVLLSLGWLSPDGALEALSTEPDRRLHVKSSGIPADSNEPKSARRRWNQIAAGEALFHTPSLLGGQAAKARISCSSCHVNGRGNPHFQFPGVSGEPGTADVTHSFFSSFRGDSEFNPISIPDLTQSGKVSHKNPGELETFIRGLIVEEFDGLEPSRTTLDALAAYVRALQSCDKCTAKPITLATDLDRAGQALSAAKHFESHDPQLTRLLVSGARSQLGLVYERFAGKRLVKERSAILALSSKIAALPGSIGVRSAAFYQQHRTIMDQFSELRDQLGVKEHESLYDFKRLKSALDNE